MSNNNDCTYSIRSTFIYGGGGGGQLLSSPTAGYNLINKWFIYSIFLLNGDIDVTKFYHGTVVIPVTT